METRETASSSTSRQLETKVIDLDGPVHYVEFGGEGRPLVLVPGLGGSIENWLSVAPSITHLGHVVSLDLRGHGRTPLGAGQTATVEANSEVLEGFIDALFDEPVVLIGNSMGGMISMMIAARRPERVAGLVLVDPSVSFPEGVEADPTVTTLFATYATPGAGEQFVAEGYASLGTEDVARRTIELNNVDPSRIDPDVVEAHLELARLRESMEWRIDAFLQATRSLLDMKAERDDYYALIRSIDAPGLIVHGDSDRLIPLAAAEAVAQLRPDWTFEIYDDTGHMPQLERPELVADSIERWLRASLPPA